MAWLPEMNVAVGQKHKPRRRGLIALASDNRVCNIFCSFARFFTRLPTFRPTVLESGPDAPGCEFFFADTVDFALCLLAARHGKNLFENLFTHCLHGCALQDHSR